MKRANKDHGGIHSPVVACYHAVHDYPGGLPVVAMLMDANADTLQKKLNINQSSHKLMLDEAIKILQITSDERILDAINSTVSAAWYYPDDVTEHPADLDLIGTMNELMSRAISVSKEFQVSLEDGSIDADERARINKRLLDLSKQMKVIDETVKRFEE